jgi:tRNA-dihydrouridine synthase
MSAAVQIYAAPMEGITGYIYRETLAAGFGGYDKYFSPFAAATHTRSFKHREREDMDPAHNRNQVLVPQILTNHSGDFIWAARCIADLGYREVNLNLGCPVGTVVRKRKGAGMLQDPGLLDCFLEEIFEGCREKGPGISLKTRIGLEDTEQADRLFEIYARYPLTELIVHPRTREQYYKGLPDLDRFGQLLQVYEDRGGKAPVCYNGNIYNVEDLAEIRRRFPRVHAVMTGRGMLRNPALARQLKGGEGLTKTELHRFHDSLYAAYRQVMPGGGPLVNRMKELWAHMAVLFPDGGRQIKSIYKARSPVEYEGAVRVLFNTCPMVIPERGGLDPLGFNVT